MAQTSHKRDPVEATDEDDKGVLLTTLDEDRNVVANLVVDVGLLSERRGLIAALCHWWITSSVDHIHFRR